MKEFWIDFQGYCLVKANTIEEAREKFYTDGVNCSTEEVTYEILGMEEKED